MRFFKALLTAGLFGLLGYEASRAQQIPPPLGGLSQKGPVIITNPDWLKKPSGEDLAFYYPSIAKNLNIEGRAMIKCTVTEIGSVVNCSVLSEAPLGMGFGRATVMMAPIFQIKPKLAEGRPISGAEVSIPVHFVLANDNRDYGSLDTLPEPTPGSRYLLEKLISSMKTMDQFQAYADRQIEAMQGVGFVSTSDRDAAAHEVAKRAIAEAVKAEVEAYKEQTIRFMAQQMTADQLAASVAFIESPAGQALLNAERSLQMQSQNLWKPVYQKSVDDARRRFCSQITCLLPAAPPPTPQPFRPPG